MRIRNKTATRPLPRSRSHEQAITNHSTPVDVPSDDDMAHVDMSHVDYDMVQVAVLMYQQRNTPLVKSIGEDTDQELMPCR